MDYLTKEVKKNTGEVPFVRVRNSHEPIIDPDVFDRVQELLAKQTKRRSTIRTAHPFAGKLICADCGATFGHKVWRVRSTGERYHVWYCNHKYDGAEPCSTPRFREGELQAAFEKVLEKLGETDPTYSDTRWREMVESVTVYPDVRLEFLLTSGERVEIAL